MENENFIEKIAKGFSQNASVKYVYGDPIQSGNKTIIPVASIAYGFGGGFGQAHKGKKPNTPSGTGNEELAPGEGAGGGGGLKTTLKGVYEITAGSTRFIPANNSRAIFTGIVIGFLLKAFFFSK